jgi:WD40 repeat protein
MILVPRGSRAFLVTTKGLILRTFTLDGQNKVFVAATVSPSNRWLYGISDDGHCHVFDVTTGEPETRIMHFAEESVDKSKPNSEITALLHHPRKGVLATFANDKGQKKGKLTLWK